MTKANIENLTPELKIAVLSIAETIKPLIEDIHNNKPTGQYYYNDYMRILAYGTKKGNSFVKLMAIAMLHLGCNPNGIETAVKNVI
jgi:hypothetical protein